jgi:hypothetical protein
MNLIHKIVMFLLAVSAARVQANPITYTYTGNDYAVAESPYTTSMSLTGSFTFSSPLAPGSVFIETAVPTAWSISDGVETITNTSGDPLGFDIATNSVGGIAAWAFETEFTENNALVLILSWDDPNQLFGPPFSFPCGNVTACDGILAEAAMHVAGLAGVPDDPGTWMPASTVPEPPSVFLVTTWLLVIMAGIAQRRNSPVQRS